MKPTIRISEIFGPTVQGEGPLIGRPAVFVRAGGCDYRCTWCDTLYAVLPEYRTEWTPMTPEQILSRIDALTDGHPILVTLTGGNPASQPLEQLIELGRTRGYSFALETQGSVAASWFAALDWLILSPKPPSSDMTTDWDALDACLGAAGQGPRMVLKIVVFDDADFAYAKDASRRHPALPVYLQVGNPAPLIAADGRHTEDADIDDLNARLRWLIGRVTEDRWFDATVLPQLHVSAWGNRRGV
jgi:7-carboxy-7-deazaguanine synthase